MTQIYSNENKKRSRICVMNTNSAPLKRISGNLTKLTQCVSAKICAARVFA